MDKLEALEVLKKELTECQMKCDGSHIVVLDRGWIFHGNLIPPEKPVEDYRLTSCVNIRTFKNVGFGGLTKGAKHAEATLDNSEPISFKEDKIIFKVPVSEKWRTN